MEQNKTEVTLELFNFCWIKINFFFFKDEVIALIEKQLCGHLGALNGTCVEYVDAYGKVIIYELSQKIDPSIICHNTLHLCSAKPPMVNKLG